MVTAKSIAKSKLLQLSSYKNPRNVVGIFLYAHAIIGQKREGISTRVNCNCGNESKGWSR